MNLKFNVGTLVVKSAKEDVDFEMSDLSVEVTDLALSEVSMLVKEIGAQVRATEAQDFKQSVEGLNGRFFTRFQQQR